MMSEDLGIHQIWQEMIDKTSPVPLYFQIERIIERDIRIGKIQKNEKLPTEEELCDIFGVSRSVIRQAVKGLKDKGLVWRSAGKGTFVTSSKFKMTMHRGFRGFYQAVENAGNLPKTKVLDKMNLTVSGKIAQALELEDNQPAFFIHRLRFIDDEPFLISRTYLPLDRIPDELLEEDFESQSLYALLEDKYGLKISYSNRAIEVVIASKNEARLLGINKGDGLILTRTITYFTDGSPFEYDVGVHRGDMARFEVMLYRDDEDKFKLHLSNKKEHHAGN
jgi:GntR family transcriptional regulator